MRDPRRPPPPRTDAPAPESLAFFLGGRDREMVEIARLVRSVLGEERLFDKRLAWGARIGAYEREIAGAMQGNRIWEN